MPLLVRAMAAFSVALTTSLLMLPQGARAQANNATGCRLVQQTAGGVTVGKKIDVWAVCNGVDYQATEFYWWLVYPDGTRVPLHGGLKMSRLQNINYPRPGTYQIEMRYGTTNGRYIDVEPLAMTAAPAAAAPVVRALPPAPPPARVSIFDQVSVNPTSLTLRTGEPGTVTATRPSISDPHIRWSLGSNSVTDRWSIKTKPFTKPGTYSLEALVWDGNNMAVNRTYTIPINVTASALSVRLQGKTNLQLNEGGGKVPVVVTPQSGVPPYHLTVTSGGRSGSRDFTGPTSFSVSTTTPGDKAVTIAVVDAKGSTFNRSVVFSVAGGGAPPANSTNPFVGSYSATVAGPNPPNPNTYWAHVVGYNSDGTVEVSLYALQQNYHVALKGQSLTMYTGQGVNATGTGSVAGNGAIGTTITMRWTLTGSDGKPTPYNWVLKKYDNRDFGQTPASGFAR